MINWVDEKLDGAPIYNVAGTVNLNGVSFRTANDTLDSGMVLNVINLAYFDDTKRGQYRFFIYGGEDAPTTEFPAAADGVSSGVILVVGLAGMSLYGDGRMYLVADGRTQVVDSPDYIVLERDCVVFCRMGDEVKGEISWR